MILDERVGRAALGQVARDGFPRLAPVGAFEEIRLKIALFMVVEGGVDRVGVVLRGFDVVDVTHLGHAGKVLDLAPGGPAVFAHLDQPVVRADVKHRPGTSV